MACWEKSIAGSWLICPVCMLLIKQSSSTNFFGSMRHQFLTQACLLTPYWLELEAGSGLGKNSDLRSSGEPLPVSHESGSSCPWRLPNFWLGNRTNAMRRSSSFEIDKSTAFALGKNVVSLPNPLADSESIGGVWDSLQNLFHSHHEPRAKRTNFPESFSQNLLYPMFFSISWRSELERISAGHRGWVAHVYLLVRKASDWEWHLAVTALGPATWKGSESDDLIFSRRKPTFYFVWSDLNLR